MDNNQLINLVSNGIIQCVQQVWETNQANDNDKNVPQLMEPLKLTEEILLALTQKIDTLGQALATIQQKVPVAPPQHNPYCSFILQHPPSFGYTIYPVPPQSLPLQPTGGTPPKPLRWKFYGQYYHSCGACDHWGSKCLWEKPGRYNKVMFKVDLQKIVKLLDGGGRIYLNIQNIKKSQIKFVHIYVY